MEDQDLCYPLFGAISFLLGIVFYAVLQWLRPRRTSLGDYLHPAVIVLAASVDHDNNDHTDQNKAA